MVSFLGISLAEKIPTSIPSIEIKSSNTNYDREEAGAWKVTKSAKWIDRGKARITFDVETIIKSNTDYKDFILVLDTSVSMEGNKVSQVKRDVTELINDILQDSENRIGLITFSTESNILSGLSNDVANLTDKVQSITAIGDTNYYKALVNVGEVLEESASDREAVVLFLTDGIPNLNTPNEIAQYRYLKDKYEYVTFTGIQYEMGDIISPALKRISDTQYISDMDTLHNVLFDAVKNHLNYDSFKITDYINSEYFTVTNDVTKTVGEVSINGNEVVWNIDNLISGKSDKETMTIDIELKDSYLDYGGSFPTNSSTKIESKIEENVENVTTENSPELKNKYYVRYDVNTPSGCNISDISNEKKSVFSVFTTNDQEMNCPGYEFKGWELMTEEAGKINDNHFVMPEKDVEFKGTWSKLSVKKSADGVVSKVQTLYNIMKDQAVPDNIASTYVSSTNGIRFSSNASNTNGKGVYEVASTHNDEYPIYYYRGDIDNNNVLFADMCFKAVISTSTGGVKLIYNGLPSSTGNCDNTGTNSQIGTKAFNTNWSSPGDGGYMYGERYPYSRKAISSDWKVYVNKTTTNKNVYESKDVATTIYYYGDMVTWDNASNEYVLSNSDNSELSLLTWESNYNDLIGKYTCFSSSGTSCESVNYIGGGTASTAYYVVLSNGNNINKYRYVSNDISYNSETGMYTLNNPIHVASTWYKNYNSYKGYYFCNDLNSSVCSTVYYVDNANNIVYNYYFKAVSMSNGETYDSLYQQALSVKWIFGNHTDENGVLQDTIEISPLTYNSQGKNEISRNHYTCFTTGDTCSGDKVYYDYLYYNGYTYYISLPKGKSVETALSEMLDYNTYSSTIKGSKNTVGTVDWWYYNNIELKEYGNYIEDTIYCNDRSLANSNYGVWNPNGGNGLLRFAASYRTSNPTIICPRDTDKFTVSDTIGNGALDYPVGLLTDDELRFAGLNTYLKTGSNYWLLSPNMFAEWDAYGDVLEDGGRMWFRREDSALGVRPVISLAPNVRIDKGDGTVNNPYQIEMEED